MLTLVQEVDFLGQGKPLTESPKPTLRVMQASATPPLDFKMYELPPQFSPSGAAYYVGYAAGGPTAGAGLYTSATTTGFRQLKAVVPYPDAGRLKTLMPADAAAMSNVQVLVNAQSYSLVDSAPYWFTGEMQDYTRASRASGQSWLRIGSEIISYEGATLVGSNVWQLGTVYRGVGGTPIGVHSPGDVYWAHNAEDGGGIFSVQYNTDVIGTTIYYKVVPVGFDNIEVDVNSVPYQSYTITGAHYAPIPSNDVRVLVGSGPPTTVPSASPNQYGPWATTSLFHLGGFFTRTVGSGPERNIALAWPPTSRATGYGVKGFGAQGYGFFVPDTNPDTRWRITIYGSGGVAVSSVLVSTPFYSYDALTNAAQNGAWRGNVAFTVQPLNSFADAGYAGVVSLNLQG